MKSSTITAIVIIAIILVICCICMLAFASVSYFTYVRSQTIIEQLPTDYIDPTPTVLVTRPPVVTVSLTTLETLENTIVPENNLSEIACRLEGICDVPATLDPPAVPLEIGDQQQFWVLDTDSNEHFRTTATLSAISDHVYFWIEDGVYYDQGDLSHLVDSFEYEIYPTAPP